MRKQYMTVLNETFMYIFSSTDKLLDHHDLFVVQVLPTYNVLFLTIQFEHGNFYLFRGHLLSKRKKGEDHDT